MFLIMAFSFDIFRWLVFIISALSSINDPIVLKKRYQKLKIMLIVLLTLPFAIFTAFLVLFLINITDEVGTMNLIHPRGIFIATTFSILLVIYLSVFIALNVVLKRNFIEYFN